MGKSIVIASAKGGVGKTTIVSNLGIALAQQGKSVALIDGSLTTPDLSIHLGIPFHVRGLAHILQENAPLESATFHHSSGMQVIPGNVHLNVLKEFEGKKLPQLIKKLKKNNDYVLVDCSAGLGREALSAMKHCDNMLVVVNSELASAVNASKAIQVAKKSKIKPVGVVMNRVGRHKQELKEAELEPLLHKVPIIGRVPEDKKVGKAAKKSEAVITHSPRSKSSREISYLAEYLDSILSPKKRKVAEVPPAPKRGFFGFRRS